LALDPIRDDRWSLAETSNTLAAAGVRIASGMMQTKGEDYTSPASIRASGGLRPDATWNDNLAAAEHNARIANALGLNLVTFHAGFLPHEPGPERTKLETRLQTFAEVFAHRGIRLGLETGQETAHTLEVVLGDLNARLPESAHLGVNFDPANMLLYGMGDPVAALKQLAPLVLQVHIKDATAAPSPAAWGTEVPVGQGAVDWPAFLSVLHRERPHINLLIERESGESRLNDISAARTVLMGEPIP